MCYFDRLIVPYDNRDRTTVCTAACAILIGVQRDIAIGKNALVYDDIGIVCKRLDRDIAAFMF